MDTNKKRPKRAAPTEPVKKKPREKVVYTEARPFNRNRFVLQLLTVVAVVLALHIGLSIFFKVDEFMISGSEKYSAYDIRQASGVQDGDNLLTLNKAKVSGRIMTQLPYVKQVRVQIQLPDTVLIDVVEIDVAYAVQAIDEGWWLMDCDGKVLENISAAESKNYTQIQGVKLDTPMPGEKAVAQEPVQDATTPEGETIPVTVYGSERLTAALSVLQNLEKRGILGNVVSTVDVSDMGNLKLQYADRYEIHLGSPENMDKKIHTMKQTIQQSDAHQSGILDFSFTVRPDEVIYTPFS